jgi:hypothetical protein
MSDIFNFKSPDLIALQRWMKRNPKQFARAAGSVLNGLAFDTRRIAIKIIEQRTTTRSKSFVKASMRVDKAQRGAPLNQLVSETFSFDISGKGRSDGFKSLEDGSVSSVRSVPTLLARGNKKTSKVAGAVRFNKSGRALRHKQFKSPHSKTKKSQMAHMMRKIREKKAGNTFIVPEGLTGTLGRMKPVGIWRRKSKTNIGAANPFKGSRDSTKKIAWMTKAIKFAARPANIKKLWVREVDFILKKR